MLTRTCDHCGRPIPSTAVYYVVSVSAVEPQKPNKLTASTHQAELCWTCTSPLRNLMRPVEEKEIGDA